MMNGVSLQILLSGASLSMVFALIHLMRKERVENFNLSLLLFCISLLQFQAWALLSGALSAHPWLFSFYPSLLYLSIVFAWRAYFFVVYPPEDLYPHWKLLFLPLLYSLPLDMYLLTTGESTVAGLVIPGASVPGPGSRWVMGFYFLSIIILFFLFLSLMIRMTGDYRAGRRSRAMPVNGLYVLLTLGSAAAVLGGYVGGSLPAVQWGSVGITLLFAASCIIGVRYPNLIQLIIREVQDQVAKREVLTGIDTESLKDHLHRLMIEEALYTSDSVSLQQVADALNVTTHQLSCLVNKSCNSNFNVFVNRYRIEAARDKLIQEPERSVLSIAFEVGFNSKSAFYEAFSKFSGMTPKEFRQKHCNN